VRGKTLAMAKNFELASQVPEPIPTKKLKTIKEGFENWAHAGANVLEVGQGSGVVRVNEFIRYRVNAENTYRVCAG
jgi:hypothetical protein